MLHRRAGSRWRLDPEEGQVLAVGITEHPNEHASSVRSPSQSISSSGVRRPIPRALNVPEAFRPLTDTIVVRDGVEWARNVRRGCSGRSGSSERDRDNRRACHGPACSVDVAIRRAEAERRGNRRPAGQPRIQVREDHHHVTGRWIDPEIAVHAGCAASVTHPAVPFGVSIIREPVGIPEARSDLLLAGNQQVGRVRVEQLVVQQASANRAKSPTVEYPPPADVPR